MMDIYLGLGSNLGDRRGNLQSAVSALQREGIEVLQLSPAVESPALLPAGAQPDWNRPFLNAVVRCATRLSPEAALERIKRIEARFGRPLDGPRWAPRPIDIDILLWGRELIHTAKLEVPHPGLTSRSFVLTPLTALAPRLTIPGRGPITVLGFSRALRHRIPLWMGIVNLTPDSFSDGGELLEWECLEARVDAMLEAGAQLIDLGAESTRPGAEPLDAHQEWSRLEPALLRLLDKLADVPLRPLVSVDTYHAGVARRALEAGADLINDVSGLTAQGMLELAASSGKDWIAMHNVTVPADHAATLPPDRDPAEALRQWIDERLEQWTAAGISLERIIFDPGIGFGKNPLQSLALLRNVDAFSPPELRVLVGHSRKSFMKSFAPRSKEEKDLVTVGASLNLCAQGIDILRVHDVPAHVAAYRGWAHLLPSD
ncbi:MAG TPA: dihydropteroate synthase [Gammaproteobacteria bacterium]|nr:dihydropteroate synthase [Gammaproteobacteria bacterium]